MDLRSNDIISSNEHNWLTYWLMHTLPRCEQFASITMGTVFYRGLSPYYVQHLVNCVILISTPYRLSSLPSHFLQIDYQMSLDRCAWIKSDVGVVTMTFISWGGAFGPNIFIGGFVALLWLCFHRSSKSECLQSSLGRQLWRYIWYPWYSIICFYQIKTKWICFLPWLKLLCTKSALELLWTTFVVMDYVIQLQLTFVLCFWLSS